MESHINKGLAYQLRAMREARGWSQEELARMVDMPQTAISRLESPNYGKPTITTLKRMAKIYDVALVVRFVSFGKLVDWVSGTPFIENGLSSEAMAVPSFDDEQCRTTHIFTNVVSTAPAAVVSNVSAGLNLGLAYGNQISPTFTGIGKAGWPLQGGVQGGVIYRAVFETSDPAQDLISWQIASQAKPIIRHQEMEKAYAC